MMAFDIKALLPRFLWNDRNGRAMAKALEAGLRDFLDGCQLGLDTWGDPEKMPEWRLDELAWEYNIPYDYTAEVGIKRKWIAEALELSKLYGTPEGIVKYLGAYFDEARIEEGWVYGGAPFHFRTIVPGSWTPENIAWADKAVGAVKNVRSMNDGYIFEGKWPHDLRVGCALYADDSARSAVPADTIQGDWYTDEQDDMLMDEDSILLTVEG